MTNFWNDLPRPFFILAPMEAVTDVVFRHVIAAAARPDVFFTEFTNTNSYCSPKGEHSTRGRLEFTSDEQPIVAHIWGDRPEYFAQMARGMAERGFAGIDINMGCPAPNVAPKGAGSGLIRRPDVAAAIIAGAKEGGLPVSVKTRLGYSSIDEWRDWLTHLLRQDIVNLTIHLRTKKEMSKVPAHYELISDIKKLRDEIAPHTLLTINGDIRDRQHGEKLVAQYGVDGIMIGRGVFTNPFAFERVAADRESSTEHPLLMSSMTDEVASTLSEAALQVAAGQPVALGSPIVGTSSSIADADSSARDRDSGDSHLRKHLQPETDRAPGPLSDPARSRFRNEETQGLGYTAYPDREGLEEFTMFEGDVPVKGEPSATGWPTASRRAAPENIVNSSSPVGHTKQELLNLLNLQLDLHDQYSNELEPRRFEPLKRFFKIYIRNFDGASELRDQLMHAKSTGEVREILRSS